MVSLSKGQRVSLSKDGLNKIMVGLGWDAVEGRRSFWGVTKEADIDCDAFAFLLRGGKVSKKDIVSYKNLRHSSKSVIHMGDNLTGEGDGDDEQIYIELSKVPADVDKIVIGVNIFCARQRKQHFGKIKNAFIRLVNNDSGQEMYRYDLSGDYDHKTAVIFGEVYRHNGEWKFTPIGEGTTDNSIEEVAERYR